MKKSMLVGNGFTSKIIPSFSSKSLLERVYSLIPNEMEKIEKVFEPFKIDIKTAPFYYKELPYFDEEDMMLVYRPEYYEEVFSSSLRKEICNILRKNNIKKPGALCQKLFIDAGLCYEMGNQIILGIETPLKIVQIGIQNGTISKQEAHVVEKVIKEVFYNNGNYHIPRREACEGAIVDWMKARKYFDDFSTIYTTNYDLILDDLVHDKVKHLHGGFCFPDAYHKDYKYASPKSYEIIVASDGKSKKRQMRKGKGTLFSKYLNSLATEDFDELYVLGYSGENDKHINDAIQKNHRINRIFVYVDPEKVNDEELRFHYSRLFREFPTQSFLRLLSWDDFWAQILEKTTATFSENM